MRRRTALLVLGGLAAAAVAGAVLLAARGSASHPPGVEVKVDVLDGLLRRPGETCSGGGGFLDIHQSGPYSIVDPADDSVLARGSLPAGDAVRIGKPIPGAAVEPTICVLTFTARIPVRERYALRLGEHRTIPFAHAAIGPDRSITVRVQ